MPPEFNAKTPSRKAGKAKPQNQTTGGGANPMVTSKNRTEIFKILASLRLGVFALNIFHLVTVPTAYRNIFRVFRVFRGSLLSVL
jgi:hypothetical protein